MLCKSTSIAIIVLVSLCNHCECRSYKRFFDDRQVQLIENNDDRSEKLFRINLVHEDKVDQAGELIGSKPVNFDNSKLVGSVKIGSPAQEFKFMFDTEISDILVSSFMCSNCGNKKKFNYTASSTYSKNGEEIKTNDLAGYIGVDHVSFGDFLIKNQSFIELTEIQNFLLVAQYDGVFPLGFNSLTKANISSPLKSMVEQKLIENEVFSIWQNGTTAGQIVFGGTDKSHFLNDIVYTNNLYYYYWSFRIDRIVLDTPGAEVCEKGCEAVINTRNSFNSGPGDEVGQLNAFIGAFLSTDGDGIWIIPECDLSNVPSLGIMIENNMFELTPEQYILRMNRDGKAICVSPFVANKPDADFTWTIGTSIIGHIYTVFDQAANRIGFAKSA